MKKNNVINNSSFWNDGAFHSVAGKYYTFHYPYPVKIDPMSNKILFAVNPNSSFTAILLHDPKFIFVNSNPGVYPRVYKEYQVIRKNLVKLVKYNI